MNNFDEYIRQGEPQKREKAQIWQTAIGLQQVDGLTPSAYLIQTAKENIEGDITIEEVKHRIDGYYKQQENKEEADAERTEEADKVSANMTQLLSEKTFSCAPAELLSIHRRLFTGVETMRVKIGQVRDYNITKSEWVLNGKTVYYASADNIKATLEYDFMQERNFSYKGLTKREIVVHIAKYISDLWQIHAFGEGNTRTIAVFAIKYLRTLGFETGNDMFAKHAWYFRNALVRANFNDYQDQIYATQEYLNYFFGNLLLGENNELKNRNLRVDVGEALSDVGEVSEKNAIDVGEVSAREKRILELVAENSSITAKQLAKLLNTTDRTIEREIKKMKESKIIERIGGDKGGFWKIIK